MTKKKLKRISLGSYYIILINRMRRLVMLFPREVSEYSHSHCTYESQPLNKMFSLFFLLYSKSI